MATQGLSQTMQAYIALTFLDPHEGWQIKMSSADNGDYFWADTLQPEKQFAVEIKKVIV